MTIPTVTPTTPDESDEPADAVAAAPEGQRRRHRLRTLLLIVGAPILAVVAGLAVYRSFAPHVYSGGVMQAPAPAPSMEGLIWTDGTPVDLTAFEGDLVVVFFGYTSCPDVCPTTLAQISYALDRLGDDADRVHVMMVSVDPTRDDPERLNDYVSSFGPQFVGASGPSEAVERVATTYGIFYEYGEPDANGAYEVAHTATILGIDRDGHVKIVWSPEVEPDALAADLDALL
jgi:protein SCO1/2